MGIVLSGVSARELPHPPLAHLVQGQGDAGGEEGEDYEVVEIFQSQVWKTDIRHLKLHAFGENFNLDLHRSHLLAPQAVVIKKSQELVGNITTEHMEVVDNVDDCHYIMEGNRTVAALNLCSEGEVSGIVVTKHHIVEVLPLRYSLTDFAVETITSRVNNLHLIKRVREINTSEESGGKHINSNQGGGEEESVPINKKSKTTNRNRVLELAVFLDVTAYKRFTEYFEKVGVPDVDQEVKHLLVSYINGIQAIYFLPSLGSGIQFSIVRIEIQTGQRDGYRNYHGDREPLLTSFCKYQSSLNPLHDGDLGHWDTALLVTGLDMHIKGTDEDGKG